MNLFWFAFFIFIYKIAYKSLAFKQALSDINFGNPPLCCLPISTINISFLTFQHRSPPFCFHMICFHSNVICCPSSFPPRGQHFLYIENRFLPPVVHPDYSFLSLFCSQFLSTAPLILKVRNIIKNAKPITRLDTEVAWCSVMSAQCLMLQSLWAHMCFVQVIRKGPFSPGDCHPLWLIYPFCLLCDSLSSGGGILFCPPIKTLHILSGCESL